MFKAVFFALVSLFGMLSGPLHAQRFDQAEDGPAMVQLDKLLEQERSRLASIRELNRMLMIEDSIRSASTRRGLWTYLMYVSSLYSESGRKEEAIRLASEALSLAEKIESDELAYGAAFRLVQFFFEQKLDNQTDYYLSVANSLAENLGDAGKQRDLTMLEARILFQRNKFNELVDLMRGYKLTSVSTASDSMFRAEVLFYDGLAKMQIDTSARDAPELHDALTFLGQRSDPYTDELRANIYGSLGNIQLSKGNFGKAVNYYSDLLNWSIAKQNTFQTMYAAYHLGRTYLQQDKSKKAEDFFIWSLQLADSLRHPVWQQNNLAQLNSMAYRDARPYDAIRYQDRQMAIMDSVNRMNVERQALEIQALYDLSRKESQIRMLEESGARQQFYQYGLVAGILLLIVIIVLIVRLNLQQRTANAELEKKNEEIARQKQKLEELNEAKNRLFSIIGHDLRGPVGNIRTFLDMLDTASEDLTAKETHEIIDVAKRSATTTYTLLNTLLDWAAHQMGEVNVTMEPVRVLDVVQEADLFLMGVSRTKNVRVTKQVDSEALVWADRNSLATVVRNLLANAIKYTPENGRIHITTQPKPGGYIITVSDTGMGIPPDIKARLFKEKVSSRAGTGKESGSGLGLFVCKSLVDELGGRIWIESEVNVGTTVYIELKVPPAGGAPDESAAQDL